VIGLFPAATVNDDDIEILSVDGSSSQMTWVGLRQQLPKADGKPNWALADYIAPADSGVDDYIGAFAVTAGIGIEPHVKRFEEANDDYSAILLKALADRLAEAFAELMHQRVRREFWGYAADEALDNEPDRRGIPWHSPGTGLPGLSGPYGEEGAVCPAGRTGHRHDPDRRLCHAADGGCIRLLFQPSGCALLWRGQGGEGSGTKLCPAAWCDAGAGRA
jgi:hypothetical protein